MKQSRADYPDQWLVFKPGAGGGTGRPRNPPAAKMSADGQLVLNHEASELLGNPARVRVVINPRQARIRLTPTTPDDAGGYALSGGGNAQARISCREVTKKFPAMTGSYAATKAQGGIMLVMKEGE